MPRLPRLQAAAIQASSRQSCLRSPSRVQKVLRLPRLSDQRTVKLVPRQLCLRSPSGVPKVPRLPRLRAPERAARISPLMSAQPLRSAEISTPATSLNSGPYRQDLATHDCAAPQECRKFHACHVPERRTVLPGSRHFCLFSLSGVPKELRLPRPRAVDHTGKLSAILSAQPRRSAESAAPATSLCSADRKAGTWVSFVCAAPQECRKCRACHVS